MKRTNAWGREAWNATYSSSMPTNFDQLKKFGSLCHYFGRLGITEFTAWLETPPMEWIFLITQCFNWDLVFWVFIWHKSVFFNRNLVSTVWTVKLGGWQKVWEAKMSESNCPVCESQGRSKHSYYGGQGVCSSCRNFFRRSGKCLSVTYFFKQIFWARAK